MKVILCIDDNGGLLFNNRRQSKDAVVKEKILSFIEDGTLWIHPFSAKFFPEANQISEDCLILALSEDFCFVENLSLAPYLDKIDTLYLFKWNRVYPYDFALDINPSDAFQLVSTEEFPGNSHENITLEVWRK